MLGAADQVGVVHAFGRVKEGLLVLCLFLCVRWQSGGGNGVSWLSNTLAWRVMDFWENYFLFEPFTHFLHSSETHCKCEDVIIEKIATHCIPGR